jgi:hypothetical protein
MFVHFFGDFIMQTDEMAKGKSTSIYWLTMHVLAYSKTMICFAVVFVIAYFFITNENVDVIMILPYIAINMGLHWVTDYFTSKQTSKLWAQQKVHEFFVMIGLDQFIHATCLIGTYYLLFL